MGAWATAQDIDDNDKRFSERYLARQDHKVTMLADARCELAKALDLVLDHPNNLHDLGGPRMKRFAVRLGVESHASRRVYSIVTGRCPHRRFTTTACSRPSASPRARKAATASTATPPATTRRSRPSPRTSSRRSKGLTPPQRAPATITTHRAAIIRAARGRYQSRALFPRWRPI